MFLGICSLPCAPSPAFPHTPFSVSFSCLLSPAPLYLLGTVLSPPFPHTPFSPPSSLIFAPPVFSSSYCCYGVRFSHSLLSFQGETGLYRLPISPSSSTQKLPPSSFSTATGNYRQLPARCVWPLPAPQSHLHLPRRLTQSRLQRLQRPLSLAFAPMFPLADASTCP